MANLDEAFTLPLEGCETENLTTESPVPESGSYVIVDRKNKNTYLRDIPVDIDNVKKSTLNEYKDYKLRIA